MTPTLRVACDTNVLVSAFIASGPPSRIIEETIDGNLNLVLLEPSMVFSNEPGIYRPGLDGYRIIDTMVVTPTGGRRLSKYLSEHGPHDRVIPI